MLYFASFTLKNDTIELDYEQLAHMQICKDFIRNFLDQLPNLRNRMKLDILYVKLYKENN